MRKLILAFSALILASGMVKPLSGRIIPTAEAQPVPCSYDYQGAGCPSGRPEISAKVACSPNQYNGGSNGITNPLGYESEPMLNATNNTWIYSSCVPPPPVCPANYIQSGTPTWLGNQWSQPSCSLTPQRTQSFQLNVQVVYKVQHIDPTGSGKGVGLQPNIFYVGLVFETGSYHMTSSYNLPGGLFRVTINNTHRSPTNAPPVFSMTVSGYRLAPTVAPTLSCSDPMYVTVTGTSLSANSATLNLVPTADPQPHLFPGVIATADFVQNPPVFSGSELGNFIVQSASCTLTITQ
jgi:hypothetical protein